MPEVFNSRKLGSVTFSANGRESIEIDRAGVLVTLWLKITYTVTNGAIAAVGPLFQTLARLIKRVEIIAGGRDTVWSVSGPMLSALLQSENGFPAYGVDTSVVLAGAAATTYTVVLPLRLSLPMARRPDDTGLDLRRINQCSLHITWGPTDATDFYTTPNAAAISAVSCIVEGDYIQDAPLDGVYLVRALDEVQRDVTGSNTNFDIILDRGSGLYYRSFTLATLADEVGSESILNDMRLEAGSFSFRSTNPVIQRARQKEYAGQRTSELIAGVRHLPITAFGQGTSQINTALLTSDLKFILDVTKTGATCVVKVLREATRPLKLA